MYKIRLPNFEGPFDLLLYFIKRDELNIYDIPIAKITVEFLKYIRLMQLFDLELAGEFLLMAATLMYIKSQMLIPKNEVEEQSDIEDPRNELIQSLLEYKQYKEAASGLADLADKQRYTYYRQYFESDLNEEENKNIYKNTSLFDLIKALKKALDRTTEEPYSHVINIHPVTVDEKKELILESIKREKRISFFSLTTQQPRQSIIVTFLAVLELIKANKIIIHQDVLFDDIFISEVPTFSLN